MTGNGPLRNAESGEWMERATNNKKNYDNWFPSVNLQYKLWEDRIVVRASWFKSIGRPNFGIYNGSLRLPDLGLDPLTHYIELSSGNADLKPWTAHTWRGEINYYFVKGGLFQITAFTRDYTNRHVETITPVTDELRAYYGIGEEYKDYFISTKTNSPHRFTLRELSLYYRQSLTFLPSWARGFTVSAGVTWRTKSGTESDTATGSAYRPRSYKTSLAYSRGRLSARVSWVLQGRYISSVYENNDNVEPGTRQYRRERSWLSADASFRITRRLSIFAQGSNLLDKPDSESEVVSPSTPGGAQLSSTKSSGIRITFGLQGSF
ncbi:outer membrane beta-barrel protein [Ereboglobus luteus]|uniref:outer membrane beta-barrel protein n=1 Tax=Ereboglobus luteus TaxID=1796921 RepID=UPI001F321706|nr:outer membrane beta-barrel protein [Ereboglobus luteus]